MVRHQFIGHAPEQQSARGVQLFNRQPFQFFAPDIEMPGDVAVRPFHKSIERHQVPHDQIRHSARSL
jgi:hypothetical protein